VRCSQRSTVRALEIPPRKCLYIRKKSKQRLLGGDNTIRDSVGNELQQYDVSGSYGGCTCVRSRPTLEGSGKLSATLQRVGMNMAEVQPILDCVDDVPSQSMQSAYVGTSFVYLNPQLNRQALRAFVPTTNMALVDAIPTPLLPFLIIGISVLTAVVCEVVNIRLIYSKPVYKELRRQITTLQKQRECRTHVPLEPHSCIAT
jgi:hypothetical protein